MQGQRGSGGCPDLPGTSASLRDRLEGIPVSGLYFALSWISVGAALVLLSTGLWNAGLASSEKGFYAMAYALSLFSAVAVQKNVRDLEAAGPQLDPSAESFPLLEEPYRVTPPR